MASKPTKVPHVVCVEWVDAVADGDPWPTNEEVEELEPEVVYAVGWLVNKNKRYVKLAKQWNENGWGGLWVIPANMLKNYTILIKGTEMSKIVTGKVVIRPLKRDKG